MENLDGVWRAIYTSTLWGEGIIVLREGRVLGCDDGWFIDGSIEIITPDQLEGAVRVSRYNKVGDLNLWFVWSCRFTQLFSVFQGSDCRSNDRIPCRLSRGILT